MYFWLESTLLEVVMTCCVCLYDVLSSSALEGIWKILLSSYEYKILYSPSRFDWKANGLVWLYFYYIHHCCKYKTSFCVVGLRFYWYLCWSWIFLSWFKCPWNVATDLGKYFLTSFYVNPGHDWKIHLILPLSVWMVKSWNLHCVGTVSVLKVMKFDLKYYFVLSVSVLVINFFCSKWDFT